MEKAEPEKAVQVFELAEKANPNHPDLYYHRGQIRFLINDLEGSVQDYKKAIALDPVPIYPHIQLAVSLYKLNQIEKSKHYFEQTLKKFPESAEVYNYYGEVLLDQKFFDKAKEVLNKSIEMDPKSPLPYINKAILFLQESEDPAQAEAECRKAVDADPLSDIALSQLAQLLSHQNKTEEAIEYYNKAIDVARTKTEILNIVSCREAAQAQLFVIQVISLFKNVEDKPKAKDILTAAIPWSHD